jgi:chemotaxis protein CheC
MEALKELINIGVGKGGEILNQMLSSHITLNVPEVNVLPVADLKAFFSDGEGPIFAAVQMGFSGSINGTVNLTFTLEDADKLVYLLTGIESKNEDSEIDMDSLRAGTMTEIGNVLINGVVGTLSNVLGLQLRYVVPDFLEGNIGEIIDRMEQEQESGVVILAKTRFRALSIDVEGDLMFFLTLSGYEVLLETFAKWKP